MLQFRGEVRKHEKKNKRKKGWKKGVVLPRSSRAMPKNPGMTITKKKGGKRSTKKKQFLISQRKDSPLRNNGRERGPCRHSNKKVPHSRPKAGGGRALARKKSSTKRVFLRRWPIAEKAGEETG